MRLAIFVDCDNAAFEESLENGIEHVLHDVKEAIWKDKYVHNKWNAVLDINGNTVGKFKLAEEEYWGD